MSFHQNRTARNGNEYGDAHADYGAVKRLRERHPGSTTYYEARLQTVVPGKVIEYRAPDWFDRPWAKVWEEYFEEGMKRPQPDESIFEFK